MTRTTVDYYEGTGKYDEYYVAIKGINNDRYSPRFGNNTIDLFVLTFEEGMDHWTPTGEVVTIPLYDFIENFKFDGSTYLD